MKIRDSGMPEELMWESFFDAERILQSFGLNKDTRDIVEFGSGYGTFTLAAAALIHGTVYALDIEPSMVQRVKEKCARSNIENVHVQVRDFIGEGTGLPPGSMDAALLFNILHHEQPLTLLRKPAQHWFEAVALLLSTGIPIQLLPEDQPWISVPRRSSAFNGASRQGWNVALAQCSTSRPTTTA